MLPPSHRLQVFDLMMRVGVMAKLSRAHVYTRDQLATSWNSDKRLSEAGFNLVEARKLRSIGTKRLDDLANAPLASPKGVPGSEIDWAQYDVNNPRFGTHPVHARPKASLGGLGTHMRAYTDSSLTRETQTSFDGMMRSVGDWREVESTTYNTTYWFNNVTGETKWMMNEGEEDAQDKKARSGSVSSRESGQSRRGLTSTNSVHWDESTNPQEGGTWVEEVNLDGQGWAKAKSGNGGNRRDMAARWEPGGIRTHSLSEEIDHQYQHLEDSEDGGEPISMAEALSIMGAGNDSGPPPRHPLVNQQASTTYTHLRRLTHP